MTPTPRGRAPSRRSPQLPRQRILSGDGMWHEREEVDMRRTAQVREAFTGPWGHIPTTSVVNATRPADDRTQIPLTHGSKLALAARPGSREAETYRPIRDPWHVALDAHGKGC